MKERKQAVLMIGRFQPFHKGHADLMQKAIEKYTFEEPPHVVVGVGIENKGRTDRNPFTFNEVRSMIFNYMYENKITGEIKPILDINCVECYGYHVINSLLLDQKFYQYNLFSNNNYTREAFEFVEDIYGQPKIKTDYPDLSATKVRLLLGKKDPEWEKWVPDTTRDFIVDYMGLEVAQYLCQDFYWRS